MDPVGSLIERGVTVFAQEPALVERNNGTALVTGDVPDSLYGTGVFDITVVSAAVRTESLSVFRYTIRDETVDLAALDAVIVCFLWQFCS